jgi:crossover junction endodeoxyribonuclease RusA
MEKIVLTGTPPSTSHIYKYRNTGSFIMGYMSAEGKAKKEEWQWEMKFQHAGTPRKGDLNLIVIYYFPDKRKRDIDNFSKLWMDAGTGILWEDDSQINELHLYKFIDKEKSRIEIEIT